jgi:hypothetical protein
MIMDARAHVDLIAMLHLETLSTTRHLDSASDQSNRTTHADTTIPHLQEQQALPEASLSSHSEFGAACARLDHQD